MKTKTAVKIAQEEEKKDERAKDQARAQFASIKEMVEAFDNATTDEERETAEETINNDPLSLQTRSGWISPGEKMEAEEFNILLCTGGPACRIIGELNEHKEPESPRLQYQDWFTQWEVFYLDSEEEAILLSYCNKFYFGE